MIVKYNYIGWDEWNGQRKGKVTAGTLTNPRRFFSTLIDIS